MQILIDEDIYMEKTIKRLRGPSGDCETLKPESKVVKMGDTAKDCAKSEGAVTTAELTKLMKEVQADISNFRKSMEQRMDNIKKELLKKIDIETKSLRDEFHMEIVKVTDTLGQMNGRLDDYDKKQSELSYDLKRLKYRLVDQEARSRRNNVLIFGIAENKDECCATAVTTFIEDHLGISRDIAIQRAHRIGKSDNKKVRPIIAMFRDYPDVDDVMSKGKKLAKTGLAISRDYPAEIRAARAKLFPLVKNNKKDGRKAWVVYPAKLMVEGELFHDALPDWNAVLLGKPPPK